MTHLVAFPSERHCEERSNLILRVLMHLINIQWLRKSVIGKNEAISLYDM